MLRLLDDDGWELARTRGSHRQYRPLTKPGTVTVPGKPREDLHPKTCASIVQQAGLRKRAGDPDDGPGGDSHEQLPDRHRGWRHTNYSAYCPDLPGVAATGATFEQCRDEMAEAIAFHIEGMREAGEAVPAPASHGAVVVVAA